jgi:hypothetical protein
MTGGTTRAAFAAARIRAFAALLALVLGAAPGAHATLPAAGWTPASQGLVPMAATDDGNGFAPPYIYPVTRLRPDPSVPGRIFASHLFDGLYVSVAGTWQSLTPGCLLATGSGTREALLQASGLSACGIIDLALDPLDPKTIYVSAVDTQGVLRDPHFDPGGVFRSQDGGVHWIRISKAFRAGGLAVARVQGQPAVIVVGSFQRASQDVGTTTSLQVSTNDGQSWRGVSLKAPPGCPSNYVTVSPHLVANVAFHPTNPNIVYAGTNAGLYMSTTKGATWSLALKACGKYSGVHIGGGWGVAFARQGTKVTVYSATWDGIVRRAVPGTKVWTNVAKINAVIVRDLIVDVRNPALLYAAAWGSHAVPGVYRISGSSVRVISDNSLKDVASKTGPAPKVYNIAKEAPTLSIAQHPLAPDVLYAATILGGVFVRSESA